MRPMFIVISLSLTPFTCLQANASLSTECIQEYKQGHLEKALYYCHGAANHPEAQYILGKIYSLEGMASTEMKKAYDYFAAAANQNYPDAQFMMALCYQNGLGVEQNNTTAAYWYKQACLNGLEGPDLNPQLARTSQVVVPQALPQAEELIAAAEKGLVEAEYQLGLAYSFGKGVPQDDAKAWEWLSRAAHQQHQGAQSYLAWMSALGMGQPENKNDAIQWFILANQKNTPTKIEPLSELDEILSLPQDTNSFVERSAHAEYLQGIELFESRLSEQDYKDGLTLLEKAADEHYAPAQLYLAKLYHEGTLVEKDLKKAASLYTEAAYNGNSEAQYTLGWMYFYGEGVPENRQEAFEWFHRANEHEARAKDALQFMETQRPAIELGDQKIKRSLREQFQRAGMYLKSLLPSRKAA